MNKGIVFAPLSGILLILLCVFSPKQSLNAQNNQSVYAEVLGSGIFYTVNFDTRFSNQYKGLGMRLGLGVFPGSDPTIIIPAHVNYLLGSGRHKLEIGLGMTTILEQQEQSDNDQHYKASGALMYRFQADNGFLFRAGLAPLFADVEEDSIFPNSVFLLWPGVSVGYSW